MHLAWGTQTPPARCPRVPTAAAMTKLTVSYGQIRTIPNPTGTATFVGLNSRTQSISTQSEPNYRTPNSTPMCTLTHELFRSPWDKRTVWKHYWLMYYTQCTLRSYEPTAKAKSSQCLLHFLTVTLNHGLYLVSASKSGKLYKFFVDLYSIGDMHPIHGERTVMYACPIPGTVCLMQLEYRNDRERTWRRLLLLRHEQPLFSLGDGGGTVWGDETRALGIHTTLVAARTQC